MKAILVGTALLALSACSSMGGSNSLPATSFDGLTLQSQKDFDAVYAKTDVDVKTYQKVMLVPGDVAFKKDWMRDYNRSTNLSERVNEDDVAEIKAKLSKQVYEAFKTSLANQTSFELVTEQGEDVILLKPSVINLDVNAPDIQTASRQRTFVDSLGEATLFLEGFDSVTGEIVVRVIDRSIDRDSGMMQWGNRTNNAAEARRMSKRWAENFNELLALAEAGKH